MKTKMSIPQRIVAYVKGNPEQALNCPDRVLAKGPLGVAAYLQNTAPFDDMFWKSSAFKGLMRAFDAYQGWTGLITSGAS